MALPWWQHHKHCLGIIIITITIIIIIMHVTHIHVTHIGLQVEAGWTLASSIQWTTIVNNRFRALHSVHSSWSHKWWGDSRAWFTTLCSQQLITPAVRWQSCLVYNTLFTAVDHTSSEVTVVLGLQHSVHSSWSHQRWGDSRDWFTTAVAYAKSNWGSY